MELVKGTTPQSKMRIQFLYEHTNSMDKIWSEEEVIIEVKGMKNNEI